jgi:hypothetical protein
MKLVFAPFVRYFECIFLCIFLLPSLQHAQTILSQNFDGVAVGSLPTGWKTVKKTTGFPTSSNDVAVTGTTWRVDKPSTVGLATGSSSPNAALIGAGVAQYACDWLFSPAVQLKAGTLYTFSIAGVANIASDPILAYCKDVNGNGIPEPEGADATGYEEWNGIGIFGSTWASFNQSFYALESGTYFIGIQATMVGPIMSGNPYYMGIDNISVNVAAGITITVPVGGESWQNGTSHAITWTSTGVSSVNIYYSTDGGSSFTGTIATGVSAGSYTWTVPSFSSASQSIIIMIMDPSSSSPSIQTQMTQPITVTTTASKSISFIADMSGLNFPVAATRYINWTSSGITNVKLEYSTNNGANWTTIIASTDASAGSYEWTVPNTPSTSCKVRISDAADATVSAVSGTFTISSSASITVTSPNGGENWVFGSQHAVTWSSSSVTNVKIEYSTNNGTNWTTISASTAASAGTYTWTVPSIASTQCIVRVSDPSNSATYDVSNTTFTMLSSSASITVTSPNGGESWTGVAQYAITWTSPTGTIVKVEYSSDNGSSWKTIVIGLSAKTWTWTTPNISSTQCLVRVSDTSNATLSDVSNAAFSIRPAYSGTWTAVNYSIMSSASIHALAVSSNGAGGTNLFAGGIGNSVILYLSTDSGTRWSDAHTGLLFDHVYAFAFSPNGASGTNLFAGDQYRGVALSTDNGTSWNVKNTGLTHTYVTSLAVIGANLFAGTGGGVFLSTDNGTSWNAVNNGLTGNALNIRSFAVSDTNLFVGTYGGVFLSTNNGTNWTAVNSGLTSTNVKTLAIFGTNLFAGTGYDGVFLSTDNGTSWNAVNNGLPAGNSRCVYSLAISGTNLFAGTVNGYGVFLSTNNGASWNSYKTGLPNNPAVNMYGTIHALAISGTNLFAGTEGNGVYVTDISSLIPLPVELTSFIAKVKQSTADLQWTTATEVNNYGFEVERAIKNYELGIKNWEKIGFVGGSGTSNAPKEYYFTDKNIPAGKYSYRLKQIDRDGKFEYSQEVEVTASGAPKKFTLCQNYPNPFNPTTTLRYGIPERSTVKLTVYSTLGQQVFQVSSGTKDAGYHEYIFDASQLTSGVYLYKIEAVSEQDPNTIFVKTQKMILMK